MQILIDTVVANLTLFRIIWLGLGFIGFFIFYKVRKSHYENRNIVWWTWLVIFYIAVGPLIFLSSLAALANRFLEKRNKN